jgi:hypothetical protein
LFWERVIIVANFQQQQKRNSVGTVRNRNEYSEKKWSMTGRDGKKTGLDGVMTVTDDNHGAGRFTNGQRGQAGVRAINRALARHKIQSGR